jgi:hypothetical protein
VHFFRPGEYDHEAKFGECAYLTYLRQEFGGLRKFRGWGLRCTPIAEAIVEMPRSWHCSPRLEKDCELVRCAADLFALLIQSQVGAEVVVRVERDCGTPLMSFLVKVDTLLQSLWIQLAYSLVEGSEYKRCKVCSKPFAVGKLPNGRTVPRDKESCSENCRVKLCQSKQRKARKMQAEGKKPQEIAKAVNSKIETVKRWLGKK